MLGRCAVPSSTTAKALGMVSDSVSCRSISAEKSSSPTISRLGAALGPARVLAMLAVGVFGVLPFCALGMFVGTLIKGQGAPGMLQLVYLPMAFLSGLWLPVTMLPHALQTLAPVWPSYHLNQLALSAVGLRDGALAPHVLVLAGFALVFFLLAARRLRRNG